MTEQNKSALPPKPNGVKLWEGGPVLTGLKVTVENKNGEMVAQKASVVDASTGKVLAIGKPDGSVVKPEDGTPISGPKAPEPKSNWWQRFIRRTAP